MTAGVVVRSIEVQAGPEEVWRAITESEELRTWFGADVELDPRPGAPVRASWPDGARSVGAVELAEPPRRLVFRWRRIDGRGFGARVGAASRVSFLIDASADGSTVSVTEEPVELASVVSAP